MSMTLILQIFKNRKGLTIVILLSVILILIPLVVHQKYNNLLEKEYLRGVEETKQFYLIELDKANKHYSKQLELALKNHKKILKANFDLELQRVKEEVKTDVKVQTVTKTIIKELPIKAECNNVPDDFRRVYNNFINSINSTETGSQ